MGWLEVQYFLLVFVASCGVLQGVFTYRRVAGLQFFRNPALGYAFAAIAFVSAFVWFFSGGDRNTLPVLEGGQQTGMFITGSAAAILFTLSLSSLINRGRIVGQSSPEDTDAGLGDLKRMTWVECFSRICRELTALAGPIMRHKK